MINWEAHDIRIENSAQKQFQHYFNDIKAILEEQNLSFKVNDILLDLEDHIVDYLRNNNIEFVSFKVALEIINELGSPEEYTDYSNMPDLVEEINKKDDYKRGNLNLHVQKKSPNDFFNEPILCHNCNTKNELSSSYCIQCGVLLKKKSDVNSVGSRNPFSYVFHLNPEYFFSLLTFFFLGISILLNFLFSTDHYNYNFFMTIIIVNEVIIVPIIFLYRISKINFTRKELSLFLSTYLLKIFSILTLFLIVRLSNFILSSWDYALIGIVIYISFPILFTKLVYFSKYSFRFNFNRALNRFSKVGYLISTLILMTLTLNVYIHPGDIGGIASFYLFSFVFILYVCFDFLILEVIFREKDIIQNNNSKLGIGREINSEKQFPNEIQKISIRLLFLTNPVYLYSWLSLIILAVYLFAAQFNYDYQMYILDIFIINELISIPIFFVYELLNKNATKFDFFAFFYSYVGKYGSFLLMIIIINGLPNIFGIGYSLVDLIGSLILISVPIIFTWVIFYSTQAKKLQNVLHTKPSRSNIVMYFLAEGGIYVSMSVLLLGNFNPIPSNLAIISASFLILLTYLIYDLYSITNFTNNQKMGVYVKENEINF